MAKKHKEEGLKKIFAYLGIGFISFLLIFFFIGTDVLQFFGYRTDPTTLAEARGEKIHIQDFRVYAKLNENNPQMEALRGQIKSAEQFEQFMLYNMIGEILLVQTARKCGIDISENRVVDEIKKAFRSRATNEFDPNLMKESLANYHISQTSFVKFLKNSLMSREIWQSVKMGAAANADEAKTEYISKNSRVQIQYAHVKLPDLKAALADRLTVTEDEITQEMKKNKSEVKDPKSDRQRIRDNLVSRKFLEAKKKIIDQINDMAARGGSFTEAAALMKGSISSSAVFKPGEPVKDSGAQGTPIDPINSSRIFYEGCLKVKNGATSKVIDSQSGLYIFTPSLVEIKKDAPPQEELEKLTRYLEYESYMNLSRNLEAQINSTLSKDVKMMRGKGDRRAPMPQEIPFGD